MKRPILLSLGLALGCGFSADLALGQTTADNKGVIPYSTIFDPQPAVRAVAAEQPIEQGFVGGSIGDDTPAPVAQSGGSFKLAALQEEPVAPVQPDTPEVAPQQASQPVSTTSGGADASGVSFGGFNAEASTASLSNSAANLVESGSSAAVAVTGNSSSSQNAIAVADSTDATDLLADSDVANFDRVFLNPIMSRPVIRGYRLGNIRTTANGALFDPIRPDLDTPLSRFDSHIVKNAVVIEGPYSVRLGPGIAFVDVQLSDSPRSQNGFKMSGSTSLGYDTNGDRWNGSQFVEGAGADYGWRAGYTQRIGVDYQAGDGTNFGSDHDLRSWFLGYGKDLRAGTSIEFNYFRSDLDNVVLPAQVYDVDSMQTDAFTVSLTDECTCWYDRWNLTAWYNESAFAGNSFNKPGGVGIAGLVPFLNAFTIGDNNSIGARSITTWGDENTISRVSIGADFVRTRQFYGETGGDALGNANFFFGLAPTHTDDAGLFVDGSVNVTDRLTVNAGGRVDFVNTTANFFDLVPVTNNGIASFNGDENFTLGAGYVTADYELNSVWSLDAGFGVSQRAPNGTELFAASPFLQLLQQGGQAFYVGNSNLTEETVMQVDGGVNAEYCDFRGSFKVFGSYVDGFITPGFFSNQFVNENVNFVGGQAHGEYDINSSMSLFASARYVEATNRSTGTPLWGIPPLTSRVGIRINQPCPQPRWGFEYAITVVDNQDKLGTAGFPAFNNNQFGFEQATPGYNVHNIRGYYRLTDNTTLTAGVLNFGDATYQSHLDSRVDLTGGNPGGIFREGIDYYMAIDSRY